MRTLMEVYAEGKKALREAGLLDWCEAAAGSGATPDNNEKAFEDVHIAFRLLHEKFEADIETSLLGIKWRAPFCPASVAGPSKVIANGEAEIVKACSEFGVPAFLWDKPSGGIEKYAQEYDAPIFWVLKPLSDLAAMESLIRIAEGAHISALGINIDVSYGLQSGYKYIELKGIGPSAPDYYERIRKMTELPMFLKGILHPADAVLAVELGYQAVVVSNHAGRVLDWSCPTLHALPRVRAAIENRAEIYIDSGFRTSVDIFKALALGANAVLLGKPILYGLASGGGQAVKEILDNLAIGLQRIMGLTNARTIADIEKDTITGLKLRNE